MKNKKNEKFSEFINNEYPEIYIPENTSFPVDNIIVGLLKNMLRKNTIYGNEGFIVYDKNFFQVELNASGFNEELIFEAIVELTQNSQKFYRDGILFSSQIQNIIYNHDEELVSFNIEKEKLIILRDSILKNK